MLRTVTSTYIYSPRYLVQVPQGQMHFCVLERQCVVGADSTITPPGGGVCGTVAQITHSDISVGKCRKIPTNCNVSFASK